MVTVAKPSRPAHTQAPTQTRRHFLALMAWASLIAAVARTLHIPHIGDVQTTEHAVDRHGNDAQLVRAVFVALAVTQAGFWTQPPCKDGRHRFIHALGDGRWAIWVLQKIEPYAVWQEYTAFISKSQAYVQAVRDDCGIDGWLGHIYAG